MYFCSPQHPNNKQINPLLTLGGVFEAGEGGEVNLPSIGSNTLTRMGRRILNVFWIAFL